MAKDAIELTEAPPPPPSPTLQNKNFKTQKSRSPVLEVQLAINARPETIAGFFRTWRVRPLLNSDENPTKQDEQDGNNRIDENPTKHMVPTRNPKRRILSAEPSTRTLQSRTVNEKQAKMLK